MNKNNHFLWKPEVRKYRMKLLGGKLVKRKFYHIILVLFLVLSACGGGSDSDEATTETPLKTLTQQRQLPFKRANETLERFITSLN